MIYILIDPSQKKPRTMKFSGVRFKAHHLNIPTSPFVFNQISIYTPGRRQSKTFLAIFDPRSSNVKSVFDCRLPGVV